MNDISATVVESSELAPAEVLERSEPNDVDPLAIEENAPKVNDTPAVPAKKADNCDENAKEESMIDIQNGDDNLASQTERIKEELLKEDTCSINSTEDSIDPSDTTATNANNIAPKVDESEPMTIEENDTAKKQTTEELIIKIDEEINAISSPIPEEKKLDEGKLSAKRVSPEPEKKLVETDLKESESTKTIDSQINQETKTVDSQISKEIVDNRNSPSIITEPTLLPSTKAPTPKVPTPKVLSPELESPKPPPKPPTPKVKEPSPPKEPSPVPEIKKPVVKAADVEMTEVAVKKDLPAEKVEPRETKPVNVPLPQSQSQVKSNYGEPINGDVLKEEQNLKRRASQEVDTDSPLKKLCQEVEKTFPQHDTMINDYIQTATKNNIDEIQRHTEQLLAEIQTLRELAQKKEHEWNNILHLKKVKEEILLRLLRRKQVLSFEKSAEINGSDRTDPFDYLNQSKNLAIDKSDEISGLSIKHPGSTVSPVNPMLQPPMMPVTSHFNPLAGLPPPYDKAAHLQSMPKPIFQPMMMPGPPGMPGFPRDMNGQLTNNFGMPMGRQGPTKDVKSIIADYRQRNPEIAPRRGRRMKSILNPNMMNAPRPIAPKMDGMNSLNNLNMLFNNLDMNQKAMLERLQQIQAGGIPNSIFKDALVQFANMQQASAGLIPPPNRPVETVTNRQEHHMKPDKRREEPKERPPRLPPPPYPEISLLPVTPAPDHAHNSLLHGILTKTPPAQSSAPSPTLAKLLTSPERRQGAALPTFGQAKNCGEITITPVQPTPPPDPPAEKPEEVVQLDDEESPASEGEASGSPAGSGCGSGSGRLVIDEGAAPEEPPEDAPLCQGCRRRDAQFVCAGCANQWYCSRDCQVAAWDEHSEMCSG